MSEEGTCRTCGRVYGVHGNGSIFHPPPKAVDIDPSKFEYWNQYCAGSGITPIDPEPEPPKCAACDLIREIFHEAPKTNVWVRILSELFTMLHGDKDYCEVSQEARRLTRGIVGGPSA